MLVTINKMLSNLFDRSRISGLHTYLLHANSNISKVFKNC